jgi:hypothetical protein
MRDAVDIERLLHRFANMHVSEQELAAYCSGAVRVSDMNRIEGHLARCALCARCAETLREMISPPPDGEPAQIEEVRIAASGRGGVGQQREICIWEHRPFQSFDSSLYYRPGDGKYWFSIRSREESLKGKSVSVHIENGGHKEVIERSCRIDSRRLVLYYDGEIGPETKVRISVRRIGDDA